MLVSKRLAIGVFVGESATCQCGCPPGLPPRHGDDREEAPADKPWLNERIFRVGLERCSDDDCSICFVPLPFDGQQYMLRVCCMQRICNGCMMAAYHSGIPTCPFCRGQTPTSQTAALALLQKRVEVGNFSANPRC